MEEESSKKILANEPIPVGIGSFVFSIKLNVAKKIEDLVLDLSGCLKSIPGLSNLRIEPEFDSPKKITRGKHELGFLNISFDLDISTDSDFSSQTNSFRVITKAFYDVPITAVFAKSSNDDSPSTDIIRIREYIIKYLRGICTLDVIGPSPFHADFYLKSNAKQFQVLIKKERAYDIIEVLSTRDTQSDIISEFFEEIGDELNLFYFIKYIEASKINSWEKIYSDIEDLRRKKDSTLLEKLINWYFFNQSITEIMQTLIEFESDALFQNQTIEERILETYSTEKQYLYTYVEREKDKAYKYPIDSVEKLLKHYINQRYHFNQGLIPLVAAIVGGIVVTILTPLFK